ncbi:MAG: 50S ribosomal protein L13 [Candidatus Portnoybacteria bacterium]|nr:50S ribosomal protein L13 [Candidatus Portnoybacteria bacterium]
MAKVKGQIYTFDASGKILGRVAVEIANFLRGKNQPNYLPYLDCGNAAIVFNAEKLQVTGRKMRHKIYFRHSGYLGGLKEQSLEELFKKNPCEVLRKAVYGMLPDNKLRDKMIRRLKIYKSEVAASEE